MLEILFGSDLCSSDFISPVCPQKVRFSFCPMALSGKILFYAKKSSDTPNNIVSNGANMFMGHWV
jgi:hypothetical protein